MGVVVNLGTPILTFMLSIHILTSLKETKKEMKKLLQLSEKGAGIL